MGFEGKPLWLFPDLHKKSRMRKKLYLSWRWQVRPYEVQTTRT
jgi:hypothetical protein